MKLFVLLLTVLICSETFGSSCNDSHLLSFLRSRYECPTQQNYHSIAINFKTYYFSHYTRFMNACTLEGCYNGGEGIHGPILVSYCKHTLQRHTRVPASSNLVIPKVCKSRQIEAPQEYTDDTPTRPAPQPYRPQNEGSRGGTTQ